MITSVGPAMEKMDFSRLVADCLIRHTPHPNNQVIPAPKRGIITAF